VSYWDDLMGEVMGAAMSVPFDIEVEHEFERARSGAVGRS
jgi:hypothetical protein